MIEIAYILLGSCKGIQQKHFLSAQLCKLVKIGTRIKVQDNRINEAKYTQLNKLNIIK